MAGRSKTQGTPGEAGKVVELFAGVGGFRLGLGRSGWRTVWANQWEPSTKAQHAFDCYARHFLGPGYVWDAELREARAANGDVAVNEDIAKVLDRIEGGEREDIPDHDLLVGGFPCQDYSVAKTLNQARGLEGKKGVLWWQIHRILDRKRPRMVFLENVDRLLKSPATQRGRDFAIILATLSDLGYLVEWRVVNAADYGFAQRRRRVFIVAHRIDDAEPRWRGALPWLYEDGALARGLPVQREEGVVVHLDGTDLVSLTLSGHPAQITQEFGWTNAVSPFLNAGVMWKRDVWTRSVVPDYDGPRQTLGEQLIATADVPGEFFIPASQVDRWAYLKGPKNEQRTAANGHTYIYSEGGVAFPEPLDQPSRTILTGEGGSSPSRFKHVVATEDGRLRRLTPVELERLDGFPDGWTEGMPDGRRAFMMGNALVVGLVARVGDALAELNDSQAPRLAVVADA
ncbi:MAG: DNA (cytosine-5-)-methyltransferase [Planctomycetaceae bacterium]